MAVSIMCRETGRPAPKTISAHKTNIVSIQLSILYDNIHLGIMYDSVHLRMWISDASDR
jgi:hypothetical protein